MNILYNKKENKKKWKHWWDWNLCMENAEFSAGGDSTYCASHADNK